MIARRTFVKTACVAAITSATSRLSVGVGQAQQVPNSSGTESAKLKAPAGACDCHHHIYDAARFPPVQPGGTIIPNARVEEFRLLRKRIGITRDIVVTPLAYVTDNRVTLDAIARLGSEARGVAVIHPTITDAELKMLADGGIRGIRFSLANPSNAPTSINMIEPLSKRVNALGWHVQINMTANSGGRGLVESTAFGDCIRPYGARPAACRLEPSSIQHDSPFSGQGPHLGQAVSDR
jgi:hypothetical protein